MLSFRKKEKDNKLTIDSKLLSVLVMLQDMSKNTLRLCACLGQRSLAPDGDAGSDRFARNKTIIFFGDRGKIKNRPIEFKIKLEF